MADYLSAELYKVVHRKYTWIALGLFLGCVVLLTALWWATNSHGGFVPLSGALYTLVMLLSVGLYAPLITTDLVFSEQYKIGTLKNEISYGIPRSRIYLGKLVLEIAVAVLACALAVGLSSALLGKTADMVLGALIDLVMGIPHMLLLILISFACGRGFLGVVVGISLTHWTSLARLIRAEVIALRESPYIQIAGKLGAGKWEIARVHMLPHLVPQFVTGLILLFPHAILHEASITFLGFGLMPEQAAIGIILSESMGQLVMGKWWLALFPGLCLVAVVVMFQKLGQSVCDVLDPGRGHR